MVHRYPDRRTVLSGLLATLAPPSGKAFGADEIVFEAAADRAGSLDQLHAMVIAHRGKVVFARAFRGAALDVPVNVKSVSKTLVALLTGIAIDEGALSGVDAKLGDLIPSLIPEAADARVEQVSVADLLTMRAGLERTSGPNYGDWVASPDWIGYALSRPFVTDPGERFQYSTGSFHILGAVLAEATGRTLLALAREWIGDPLGIALPRWTADPQGYYLGGNNMALSPLALARIGEMVRSGGVVGGRRVVPAQWLEASFVPRTRSPWSGDRYGYGWFLTELAGAPVRYARGYGGQMLYVIPSARLTVAITSDPTRPARTAGHVGDLHRLVADDIINIVSV